MHVRITERGDVGVATKSLGAVLGAVHKGLEINVKWHKSKIFDYLLPE